MKKVINQKQSVEGWSKHFDEEFCFDPAEQIFGK